VAQILPVITKKNSIFSGIIGVFLKKLSLLSLFYRFAIQHGLIADLLGTDYRFASLVSCSWLLLIPEWRQRYSAIHPD